MPSAMPGWIAPAIVAAGLLLFSILESLRPLRRRRESRIRRLGRNLATAGIGLGIAELLQIPILLPVARWTTDHDVGLLNWLGARGGVALAASVLLLDYTLWFWHWINHRVPFFWRFHAVHHVDLDMDASTALRFHFGELGLTVFYRVLQIVAIGADPFAVAVWQALLFASILFHHSNTRLPIGVERVLVRLIVTPRMHGIHHSDYGNETNSNWSSLLSLWDYLHGTVLLDVPQQEIRIGVAAFQDPEKVTLRKILALPFVRRPTIRGGADNGAPVRPHRPEDRTRLLE